MTYNVSYEYKQINKQLFLNYCTLILGASQSGKSTILINILEELRDTIPQIIVFSSTASNAYNESNFSGNKKGSIKVHPLLIHDTLKINVLQNIIDRNQVAKKMEDYCNDYKFLLNVARKLVPEEKLIFAKKINEIKKKYNTKFLPNDIKR